MSNNDACVIELSNTKVVSDCYILIKNLLWIDMLSIRLIICKVCLRDNADED